MERELIGVISATITGMMKMLSLIGVISALIFIITGRFKNVEDLFSLMDKYDGSSYYHAHIYTFTYTC
jgi:endo-1,4-beta-D-glucanase Y